MRVEKKSGHFLSTYRPEKDTPSPYILGAGEILQIDIFSVDDSQREIFVQFHANPFYWIKYVHFPRDPSITKGRKNIA